MNRKLNQKGFSPLVVVVVLVVLLALGGVGYYVWQRSGESQNTTTSSDEASENKTSDEKEVTEETTFTYKPRFGGLTLTLPKKYGVIVVADGNKGGAPGAELQIAQIKDGNTWEYSGYQELEIEVDHTFDNLDGAVRVTKSVLSNKYGEAESTKVSDTTIAGLPAKYMVSTFSDGMQIVVHSYITGSGEYLYTLTTHGPTGEDRERMIDVVLEGMTIKPAKLN